MRVFKSDYCGVEIADDGLELLFGCMGFDERDVDGAGFWLIRC